MRSLLFVPGDSPRKLEKALQSGADGLIVDLEDAVDISAKAKARDVTAGFLRENVRATARPRLLVRVNGLASGMTEADLDAVVGAGADAVVLPKTVGGADVCALSLLLDKGEAARDGEGPATGILPIVTENARGVFALGTLAGSSPRLLGLTWGGEDLSADLGAQTNRDAEGLYTEPYRLVRSLTLLGAAAAEVDAIDAVFTNYKDDSGLAQECRWAARDGFVGKMAIHPSQIEIINAAFTPGDAVVARARAVVEAFAASPGAGVVGLEGEMLDLAHLKRAERTLKRSTQR